MTLSSSTNRNDYVGNNSTASYNYTFKIFNKNDLKVSQKDTNDVETLLTVDTDYTVNNAGDVNGGTIVLTAGNLETGYTLTIRRVRDLIQETDIRNQGDFFPESHEDAFDHQIMIAQQQQDELDRSSKLPESIPSSSFDPTLPTDIKSGNGRALKINDAGNGFELGPTATQVAQYQNAINSAPPWFNVLDYGDGTLTLATINAAITAIEDAGALGAGAKYSLLLKRGTWIIDSNKTIPSNVFIILEHGAILSVSASTTLNINGGFLSPKTQAFQVVGTSSIIFGAGTIEKSYIQWFGATGDGTTDDAIPLQKCIDSYKKVEIKNSGVVYATNTQLNLQSNSELELGKNTTLKALSGISGVLYSLNNDNVSIYGKGKIDGNGLAINGIECQVDDTSHSGLHIKGVEVTGTATDAFLFYGGILVGSLDGAAGPGRYSNILIENVNIHDTGTHGVLFAYCDKLSLINSTFKDITNHGSEAVGCTDVIMKGNKVRDCLISALGVGSSTAYFNISNNIISNCGGDGAITVEHNSVIGTISNNIITDCFTQGINISYGTPGAGIFATIHDVNISGNVIKAKNGSLTGIGMNIYGTPSVPGYNINIFNNTIEDFNKLITLSYMRNININGIINDTTQGTSSNLIDLVYVKESSISNITSKAILNDHAIKINAYLSSKSERISINNIIAYSVDSATKSIVKIQNGSFFKIYSINTSGALHAVDVDDASTSYLANGIDGNYAGSVTNGGTKGTW